jgi:hypothetical protein
VEGKVNIKIFTFGSGLPPTRGLVPLAILPPLGERMVERPVWILDSSREEEGVCACANSNIQKNTYQMSISLNKSVFSNTVTK